ncbi:EnvZ/OmpR regulon moderator MzrA [Enterobacteriaceae bacterium H20N1]|uniref:Modulator protein MzrA n=1 Tax=Dryocola boscaweniae TaxID=2925397 RepID=A0A9X2W7H2_9ENTR|nr:EnvZ/OmpR regulon moderator MzrA [Dryocola boscaweniae]MCT4701971.1 EnvZ/OmpR regulon moderator MzrA [Dryocola boscaweniae]MCT4714743.1 EnvZ/OmpR regulon moderator MzrA [Dryocola boscaweniae]MCT4719139.1 EnvZ/OmpR regulon moderator MzrA [Dryocola boscaweniae]
MKIEFTRRLRVALLFAGLAAGALLVWSGMQRTESTLQIRASQQGISMPDGFFVWHHLDANGIRFNSITPENDSLLIKFDSSAQSEAARVVLYKTLPHGYVIAQQDDDNSASTWLSRLRTHGDRIG